VEETDLLPYQRDVVTLLAARLGDLLLQVTKDTIETATIGHATSTRWVPEGKNKITCAASSGGHLLVGLDSGQVILLAESNGVLLQKRCSPVYLCLSRLVFHS
jgi:hypothetical protein